jgi:hypothetical protein
MYVYAQHQLINIFLINIFYCWLSDTVIIVTKLASEFLKKNYDCRTNGMFACLGLRVCHQNEKS